ncbi:MAG: replicative DNA helicase [Gammaproteobacteria bacterium]|nr:replicative DNA helicase [Gammaproteobacteria bacterium]MDE0451046.1 replicative DNA helicase [Gammaproteobacteria bacterium]
MAEPSRDPSSPTRLKVPPHSIEAEQSVLGGLMIRNEAWDTVADRIAARDFYRPEHQIIFEAMATLANDLNPLDVLTVAEALESRKLAERVGGIAYLAELAEETPSAANIGAYADIVRERAVLRQLISAGSGIAESAFTPEGRSSDDLLDSAMKAVFDISDERLEGDGPLQVETMLESAFDRVNRLSKNPNAMTGLETGFADLDRYTAGLQDSDFIVIAGRPSMGKTALAVNIAEHAVMHADDNDPGVLIFSMEQPAEQLVVRLLSSLGRIDQNRLRTGQLNEEDWPRLESAINQLKHKPLYIDDTGGLTPNAVRARARRVARTSGLKLIVVDYMQLMRAEGRSENRTLELSEISRILKSVARELRCPLIALSQLNRALENREDKRPRMSDLRESGAIEQDADVIFFIYRDEEYNKDSEEKGIAEVIIGKQRNGPTGMVKMWFRKELTKFETRAPEEYEPVGQG